MNKIPQRRYVKFEFFGYAPVDLAIQLHLLGKQIDVNMVGEEMQPYSEYNGEYDKLHNLDMQREYYPLREWLSEREHIQWEHWSKELAQRMEAWCNQDWSRLTFKDNVAEQIMKWKVNWKPYEDLPEDIKEYDREWADKILDNVPFKCPMYQCGGIMVSRERPYPKGMNEGNFPDGMVGDSQTPDLICTNCKAVYSYNEHNERTN